MSRRKDIVSCIDVTIMDRFAHSALPSSYSKIFPAFGAGAAVTHAAGLGGKRFIDFVGPHACVSAFILQHGSKCAPTGIEHRLGQSSLCQSGGIHVADDDRTVALHQTGAQFMQEIFSPIRDLGVNYSGSVSMPGALGASQGGFQVTVKALGLDRRNRLISERGKSPQPQIDAQTRDRAIENRSHGRFISLVPHSLRHTDNQIPASAAAACTAALAPSQANFPMLSAPPPRIFFRDLLHRPRLRVSLSLAGLKASVSRKDIG
jgi:hypothetical protein